MSDIFKGQMGKGTLEKGASYKSAGHPYDPQLVNDLVRRCEYLGTNTREELEAFVMGAVPKQLESVEGFDPNAFLEAIIAASAVNSTPDDLNLQLDFLISTSMQALYGAGVHAFHIDFRHLPRHKDYFVVCKVKGSKQYPLKLTTAGDVLKLGSGMEHCELEVAEGSVQCVGTHAISSVFRLNGQKTEVASVGLWGTDSDYFVKTIKPVLASLKGIWVGKGVSISYTSSKNCRFYIEQGVSEEALQQFKEASFFSKGNKIIIPGGTGQWKEVFPG